MIEAINETQQTLVSNIDTVKFNQVSLRTNSAQCFNGWLGYNQGEPQFNIVAGGIYEIAFNANVTSATAGNVAFAIFADGSQLIGTEMDTPVTVGVFSNIANKKYIRVCGRGNVTLTIQSVPSITYNGTTTATQIPIVKNANISIRRLNG